MDTIVEASEEAYGLTGPRASSALPAVVPLQARRAARVAATAALLVDAQSIALPASIGSPDVQRHPGDGTTVLFATVLEATRCLDALGSRPVHPGCVMLPVDTGATGHADVLARGRDWLRARPGEQVVSARLAPLVAPLLPRTLELTPLTDAESASVGGVGGVGGVSARAAHEAMYAVRPKDFRRTSARTGMTWARRVVQGGLEGSPAFAGDGVRVAHVHGQVGDAVSREVAQVVLAADAEGRQVLFARAGRADDGSNTVVAQLVSGGSGPRLGLIRQLCAGYAEALDPATLRRRVGGDLAPLAQLLPGLTGGLEVEASTGVVPTSGLGEFDLHLRALLSVVATAPTLLVVAVADRADSASCVLLERVLAAAPTTRLLTTGEGAHPLLERRLRRRFGHDHLSSVAGDRLRSTPPTLVARAS